MSSGDDQPEAGDASPTTRGHGEKRLTFLFTDIKGCVPLFQALGNERARSYTREHDGLIRKEIDAHDGWFVDQAGDSLFGAFHDANSAVRAAFAMQEAIRDWWTAVSPGFAFGIRIGLHEGVAIAEGSQLAGDAVNLASRTMGQADADEIVISDVVHGLLTSETSARFAWFGPFLPKGARDVVGIYRWQAPWKGRRGSSGPLDDDMGSTLSSDLDERGWQFDPRSETYGLAGLSPENTDVQMRIGGEFRTVGRGTTCDYRLDSSRVGRKIGRRHMGFIVARRQGWVFDLGGNGGVLVSYSAEARPLRVAQRAPVSVGSFLQTGMLRWRMDP